MVKINVIIMFIKCFIWQFLPAVFVPSFILNFYENVKYDRSLKHVFYLLWFMSYALRKVSWGRVFMTCGRLTERYNLIRWKIVEWKVSWGNFATISNSKNDLEVFWIVLYQDLINVQEETNLKREMKEVIYRTFRKITFEWPKKFY